VHYGVFLICNIDNIKTIQTVANIVALQFHRRAPAKASADQCEYLASHDVGRWSRRVIMILVTAALMLTMRDDAYRPSIQTVIGDSPDSQSNFIQWITLPPNRAL